jgi:hypothetical protein
MRRQFLIRALVRALAGREPLVETLSDLNRVNGLPNVRVADLAGDLAEVVSESITPFWQVATWHYS